MKRPAAICAIALLAAQPALAQPTGEQAAPRSQPDELVNPPMPEVNDVMLAPPPAAEATLTSWPQAVRLIRDNASSLRLARAEAQQTAGQSRQAFGQALPTLTGTGTLTHHLLYGQGYRLNTIPPSPGRVPDPGTSWQAAVQLRAPVFAPRAWYDYRTARDSVHAARLNVKEAERLAVASAADAIVAVVTAERLAEVSRVSLRFALSTADLTRRRAELGASNQVDVLRAEQEVALTRAQVIAADEDLLRAREALGAALGTDRAWGVTPDIRLNALANDAQTSCRPEPSIDQRPDVRAAQANLQIAERGVKSIDWSYVPSVDFVSTLTVTGQERQAPNREPVFWTIGGVLTWNLYDGGLRYGAREIARGQSRAAREQLVQAKRQARFEVAQAFRGVRVAESNLKVSRRSREIASESARLSRVAFLNGSGTSFDLVDTSRRLREAELDLAIKEFEVVRAKLTALLALATCEV